MDFLRCVLADDCASLLTSCFTKCQKRAKSTWVIDSGNKDSLCPGPSQVVADAIVGAVAMSVGSKHFDLPVRQAYELLDHTKKTAEYARIGHLSRFGQLEQQELVKYAAPVQGCPASKMATGYEPSLAIICAVVNRVRQRNFN